MLQQTQVATVVPFYLRFLRAYPTVSQLAQARLEKVLELWSGLGYYRRARNLHSAARLVVRKYHGSFPRDYHHARTLPGIGDYTARAILSIAYQQPLAVLDGNVARVLARLKAIKGSVNQPAFRSAVGQELERLLAPRRPGNFNQALMELGQTVCLPRAPRCAVCPLQKWCEGFRRQTPEAYPEPRPRRATELHYLAAAVIRRGPHVALIRGLEEGLLADLWNFPAAFGSTRRVALHHLNEKLSGLVDGEVEFGPPLAEVRHTITHRSIHVHLYPAQLDGSPSRSTFKWVSLRRLGRTAVSQLARKISVRIAEIC